MPEQMELDWCVLEAWNELNEGDMPNPLLIDRPDTRLTKGNDISEVYSPPRVTKMARQMGMSGGWALDLTTADESGEVWDFTKESCREKARKLVKMSKPTLLIGSPECRCFSQIQTLNRNHYRDPADAARSLEEAIQHMEFVTELYRLQLLGGRYFLHEQASESEQWKHGALKG